MAKQENAKAKSLPNAVRIRATPSRTEIPAINPFTGKRFASEAEQIVFANEQQAKVQAMRVKQVDREEARNAAVAKITKIFLDHGVTEKELQLVFGRKLR